MAQYLHVVLCVDVMKVNKMPFLVAMSPGIKFGTVAWLKNANAHTIMKNITEVHNVYIKRGFLLEILEADGQFEPLQGKLADIGVTLNKCSREEHVPVAERRIRTLKERCHSICNTPVQEVARNAHCPNGQDVQCLAQHLSIKSRCLPKY
jgi:hypothetical protein